MIACAWAVVGQLSTECSWISEHGLDPNDVTALYATSLHWSIMTLTSIGYGDTATPCSVEEYYADSFLMVVAACIWAYIIGTFLPFGKVCSWKCSWKLVYE